ncbi:MAG: hypothetical protein COA96_14185 [SAR86 cluster bacterium]|uniref:Uncharacterized protein n=1 Tax=SAR86 cluster bacterium TaxID=2030880 RepID=A0A2A5AT74_9GAMM|nr:MAG: hypothetical protein COA96_14185 [SAR86 cluster bacterium]
MAKALIIKPRTFDVINIEMVEEPGTVEIDGEPVIAMVEKEKEVTTQVERVTAESVQLTAKQNTDFNKSRTRTPTQLKNIAADEMKKKIRQAAMKEFIDAATADDEAAIDVLVNDESKSESDIKNYGKK